MVPNKYPAFDYHEVVVHTPRHARSIAELSDDEARLVAEAWRRRSAVFNDRGFSYVQAVINEGREAGASLPHTHSQLVGMREPPPLVKAEERQLSRRNCRLCELISQEHENEKRLVLHREGVVAFTSYAGRTPYEVLIAPVGHLSDPFAERFLLDTALSLMSDVMRRVFTLEGPVPLNAWVHPRLHWHIEVVPRLTVPASLELGAGIYLNPLPPEQAAERLRQAQP